MNQDYEQLKTAQDMITNPFSRTRKGGFNEIMRNKNRLGKYIIIFGTGLIIIFLCIFLASKSSQLSSLREENLILFQQLEKATEEESELKGTYSSLSGEKQALTKQNEDLSKNIKSLEEKNKALSSENEANNKAIEEIKEKLANTNQEIEDLNKKNEEAEKQIQELESTSEQYSTEIEELKKQIKELEDKIDEGGRNL